VDWAADAKALFVSSNATGLRSTLLYVDLQGRAHVLLRAKSLPPVWAIPSHDGKYVAMLHPDGSKQRLDAGELLIALGTGQKEARPPGQGPRLLRRHRPPRAAGEPQQFSAIGHRSGVRQSLLLCKSSSRVGRVSAVVDHEPHGPRGLEAALDAWAGGHCDEAFANAQLPLTARSLAAARRLFATGW
jgi:hypothetical protein